MTQLVKVRSNVFNDIHVDFYKNESDEIIMTAEQIGSALGYANPRQSIINLFNRNKARLEKYSVETKLISTDGKEYGTRIFNEQGIYGVIFLSNNKKAIEFQEWVYGVIIEIRKTGFYMATTDVQVPELLEKVNKLENKIESFITITSYEARIIQKAIGRRVYTLVNEPDQRGTSFQELHREIRDRFGVPSYRDLPKNDFQTTLLYINAWIPKKTA